MVKHFFSAHVHDSWRRNAQFQNKESPDLEPKAAPGTPGTQHAPTQRGNEYMQNSRSTAQAAIMLLMLMLCVYGETLHEQKNEVCGVVCMH